jgi:hypothetical protein
MQRKALLVASVLAVLCFYCVVPESMANALPPTSIPYYGEYLEQLREHLPMEERFRDRFLEEVRESQQRRYEPPLYGRPTPKTFFGPPAIEPLLPDYEDYIGESVERTVPDVEPFLSKDVSPGNIEKLLNIHK